MKFDVYCDESYPDLLSSRNPRATYLFIGSLWLESSNRQNLKKKIGEIRDKHKVGGEFKWQKVSQSRLDFYKELIDLFISQGDSVRYRCIAVKKEDVDLQLYHENDQELGFYKFYYQVLHHWIDDFNEYAIFVDFKRNRRRDRLHVLQRCLAFANLSSLVKVQSIRSDESVLIQFSDLLTGAASARLNEKAESENAKKHLLDYLELKLGRRIAATPKSEQKFNVFKINLQGGW